MNKVIIIAEAGVNHNGDINIAKKLIDAAAAAGVDYVKFQTFKAEKLATVNAKKAEYQISNTGDSVQSQYDMLKALELSEADHFELRQHCNEKGVRFLSTGFDHESIDFLHQMGMDFFKIPSGEITNKPYLIHVASKGLPVVLSTGMSTLGEIEAALQILREHLPKDKISILHCNTEYPTPYSDVNLLAMKSIAASFGVGIGFSDHTLGVEVPVAAVALGAKIIEKHFTLDKNLPGPDHKASLEPEELKQMVIMIRNVEAAVSGSGLKEPSASEAKNRLLGRKSIHFASDFPAGTLIEEQHFMMLRPGTGISPMMTDQFVGKVLKEDVRENQMVSVSNFYF